MSENYNKLIESFLINNQDLISTYESGENAIPITYLLDDVIDIYKTYKKDNQSISIDSFLYDTITTSIKYNLNLLDGISMTFTRKLDDNRNSTQTYFNEVNDIYVKNNNNYDIQYCPENRDKMIEMNLKTVISIAKRYQGLGLSLNELISAGNLGLVISWDKFDPNRSKLHDDMINVVSGLPDQISYDNLYKCLYNFLTYGDILEKFNDTFIKRDKPYDKKYVIKWIDKNIYNAKFNSIATMWIKAYILIEIDNNSRVVRKPKVEIYKDKKHCGAYKKEIVVDIDAPISDDATMCVGDTLAKTHDNTDLETSEYYYIFKTGLNKLLTGVKSRDRHIFLKKFGIGLPRPLLPKEIAEQEGLSIARISQIFQTVIMQIKENQKKYNIDLNTLLNAAKEMK